MDGDYWSFTPRKGLQQGHFMEFRVHAQVPPQCKLLIEGNNAVLRSSYTQ
jgi:hypothetical protein